MPKYLPAATFTRQVTARLFRACVRMVEEAEDEELKIGVWKLALALPKLLYRLGGRTNSTQRYKQAATILMSNNPVDWRVLFEQAPGMPSGTLAPGERAHQLIAVGELSRALGALTATGGPTRLPARQVTDVLYPSCEEPDSLLPPLQANVDALR